MNHLVLAPQLVPSGTPMISARRLVARSRVPAHAPLRGVHLDVKPGAFLLVLGQGGSTFVRLLAGLERPERGLLSVDGVALERLNECEALAYRRHAVNVVLSGNNLLPDLTLTQNLELSLLLTHLPRQERRDRARSALEFVGLGAEANRRVDRVSRGAAQRAAIARTLLTGANLLVLDEPCAGAEPGERGLVLDLLTQLNRVFRKTIVLASEDRTLVERASQLEELLRPEPLCCATEAWTDFTAALPAAGAVSA